MSKDASGSGTVGLLCPVVGCRRALTRTRDGLACPRAHSFDVARSGYVNLLLPQDRRSRNPGDAPATVAARLRIEARGYETPLTEAITDFLTVGSGDAVLDVGCGEGHHLAAIAARFGAAGYGLDISVPAIDAAARLHPELHWVVSNADRFLPYADASFRLVASITAQRNPEEFRRVLADEGTLLVVVPAPDDLIEAREVIMGEGVSRDRVDKAIEAFAPLFVLDRHERIRHMVHLDSASVHDVMVGTYRAGRASRLVRLATVSDLNVTLSRDVLLFHPARRRPAHGARRRAR
ncbi:MAG TPA: methyltransferase domain-containing protein [Methylomirabilota bacterium]|nr:methyltransferase domain-containing protein [Methylomirabilota bacterium]